MAKDRKKLQHIHSSVLDKQPTAASLEVGEIAVNNAATKEFLSIKNSNDEVVRFSSDEQIITWTEKKEVMPYSGTVDNVHLDTNRSNIEIKLNQVAASKTVKSDVVNGAKDIDGNPVNPSEDGGLTNGAGFAIDMSLYAMQGANPSFSSITVTNRSDLNGVNNLTGTNTISGTNIVTGPTSIGGPTLDVTSTNTHIKSCSGITLESRNLIFTNGDCGTGEMTIETDDLCLVGQDKINVYGKETNIGLDCDGTPSAVTTNVYGTTTNVGADDLNVKTNSFDITAATETGYIGSATNVIGTNDTTISGNTVLKVSGTTTETKVGNVTESNLANKTENTAGDVIVNTTGATTETKVGNVTENHSGTTVENKAGNVTENNLANKTENTTANVAINTTGTTTEVKIGNVTENHSGTTTETKAGDVIENNLSNKTENTSGNVVISTTGSTTETKGGAVIENNNSTKTENTVGNKIENNNANYTVNTTGVTELTSTGNTNIHSDANICETADVKATFYGAAQTNVGLNCTDNDASTVTNVYGDTLNVDADTANTTISAATTNITGATTTIGTANTTVNNATTNISAATTNITTLNESITDANVSAKTATVSGNTLAITEATSTDIKSPTTSISGTNFNVTENYTRITSCGQVLIETDNYILRQCSGGGQPSSGGSAEFDFCSGYTVNSDNITLQQCSDSGSITIKEKNATISGTNLTVNENAANSTIGTANTNITTANVTATTATLTGTNLTITEGDDVTVTAGDAFTVNATGDACITSQDEAAFYGNTSTKVGVGCDGSVTTTATMQSTGATNVYGTTVNVTGATNNNTFTTINTTASTETHNSNAYTLNGDTLAINESVSTTVKSPATTISGTSLTVNESNVDVTACTEYKVDSNAITLEECTAGSGSLTIKEKTTNISGTTLNVTGTTNINGDTNITGNTYVSGNITLGTQCNQLTSTTVAASFCEVFDRTKVTMTRDSNPSDSGLSAVYKIYQDGAQIGYDINVPKDGFLKSVELVNVDDIYYLRFTWNIYDADTQTYTTGSTDVNVEDLVKDIDENNTKADRGVNVDVWYNATDKKMNVSADTTVKIVSPNGDKTFSKSGAVNSLNSYKLSYSHNGFSGEFDPFTANSSFTSPHSSLTWSYAATSGKSGSDSFNTSADKSINIPTAVNHLNRGKLTVTHNGLTDTFDPATDKSMTLPHSALTIDYGVDVTSKTDDTYDTSAAKTVSIPTAVSHINRGKLTVTHNGLSETFDPASDKSVTMPHSALTIDYGVVVTGKTDDSYDTSAAKTVSIPTAVSHISRGTLSYSHNGFSGTFDPASNGTFTSPHSALTLTYGQTCNNTGSITYDTSAAASMTIPATISDVTCGDVVNESGCLSIGKDVCVTGKVTASNGFFQTSDRNSKENIIVPTTYKLVSANKVPIIKFNYKDDETKRDIYGVIAQEAENFGLNELVYTDENGKKSVDYTSLTMLKIAFLENENKVLRGKLDDIEKRLKALEGKNED